MDTYSSGTTSSGSVATRGTFTENTRVHIPAVLHLVRLGYEYLSHIGDDDYDHRTNILKGIFLQSLKELNPDITYVQAQKALDKLSRISANDDLGLLKPTIEDINRTEKLIINILWQIHHYRN